MPKLIDEIGNRYGQLTVVRRVTGAWKCRCDCGNTTVVSAGNLRSGRVKSCGCMRRTLLRTHGGYRTATYRSWRHMRSRCLNPRDLSYQNYGGRGITICERWNDFSNFLEDMGEVPEGMSMDRINNNGNYEPGNCRWTDDSTQKRNRRKRGNTSSEYRGVSKHKHRGKWRATIVVDGKQRGLGHFDTEKDAARAYDAACWKEFHVTSYLNFPDEFGAVEEGSMT